MNIYHGNEYVEDARDTALQTIESIKYLADRVKEGGYCGRLYSKLIEGDPINSALKAIDEYNKTVEKYNVEKDHSIDKAMEEVENQLIDTLIGMAENNDFEAIDIILQINATIKTRNYGLQAIKRITDLNKPINFTVTLSILPEELLPLIFRNNDVQEIGRLMQASKSSCKLASKDCIWKEICLQEDPTIINENNISWKELCRDKLGFNRYIVNSTNQIFVRFALTGKSITVEANLNSDSITAKHLKQIIKKKENLDCKISQMILLEEAGRKIEDTCVADKLRHFAKVLGHFILIIKENPPLEKESIENTIHGKLTITENHPGADLEKCVLDEEENVEEKGHCNCRCIMF